MRVGLFFPLVRRRLLFPPPPLRIPDLSLPLPSFFPSFLRFQVLGFFSLARLWPKAQKRRFRKRLGRAQGPFVCFGTGAGNLARPESRRLLQGNASALGRLAGCAPAASMGEMQGALARARLQSLLRPRHKKRAEAQKRSESFLLTGLGKRGRHAGTCHCPRWARAPSSGAGRPCGSESGGTRPGDGGGGSRGLAGRCGPS